MQAIDGLLGNPNVPNKVLISKYYMVSFSQNQFQ